MTTPEADAIALYAIGARDWLDFIEMVAQPKTISLRGLELLRDMLATKREGTDNELNALLLPIVIKQIAVRVAMVDAGLLPRS